MDEDIVRLSNKLLKKKKRFCSILIKITLKAKRFTDRLIRMIIEIHLLPGRLVRLIRRFIIRLPYRLENLIKRVSEWLPERLVKFIRQQIVRMSDRSVILRWVVRKLILFLLILIIKKLIIYSIIYINGIISSEHFQFQVQYSSFGRPGGPGGPGGNVLLELLGSEEANKRARKEDGSFYSYIAAPIVWYPSTIGWHTVPSTDRELAFFILLKSVTRSAYIGSSELFIHNTTELLSHRRCVICSLTKEKLATHIFNNRYDIPTAYTQMISGNSERPNYERLRLTEYVVNSLKHSNN